MENPLPLATGKPEETSKGIVEELQPPGDIASALKPRLLNIEWTKGHCPICETLPELGLVRADSRRLPPT